MLSTVTKNEDIFARITAIDGDLRAVAAAAAKAGLWPVVRAASLAAESLQPVMPAAGQTRESATNAPAESRRAVVREGQVRRSKNDTYPRFVMENSDLVKIGWSKSERAEYRHRAPQSAVVQVAAAIVKLAGPSGSFVAEALFPVIDARDGTNVPDYQGYLALRWFRQLELVEQQGRTGYRVRAPGELVEAVKKQLKQLAAGEAGTKGGGSQ